MDAGGDELNLLVRDLLDLSAYRAEASRTTAALDVRSDQPDLFRGRLVTARCGDISVVEVDADAHSLHRTPDTIARAPRSFVQLSLIEQGRGRVAQAGRDAELGPGDMALCDTALPYSMRFETAVRLYQVMFPREILSIPASSWEQLLAVRLDGDTGFGAVARPFFSSLRTQLADADERIARMLVRTAVDMIETFVEARLQAHPREGGGAHKQLMSGIIEYIDEHLSDPELDPLSIAMAHFISVRHLQGLFQAQGTTVSKFIRHRRLHRCYDELADPRSAKPITAIALSNGFVAAGHFSRTFRAHFGVTPRSVRLGIVEGGS